MKKWIVKGRRGVDDDIAEISIYLGNESDALALRFIDAVETSIRQLATMPEVFVVRKFKNPRLAGLRAWRVEGFPRYLVFYQVDSRAVTIFAVVHGARDLPRVLGERAGE